MTKKILEAFVFLSACVLISPDRADAQTFKVEKFDINKYFDLSFIEQANKDLGPYK